MSGEDFPNMECAVCGSGDFGPCVEGCPCRCHRGRLQAGVVVTSRERGEGVPTLSVSAQGWHCHWCGAYGSSDMPRYRGSVASMLEEAAAHRCEDPVERVWRSSEPGQMREQLTLF